jgi:predicted AAA+ superfamily ATPase
LSQGEIEGHKENFIDKCFNNKTPKGTSVTWPDLMQRINTGGYPEALRRNEPKRRRAWYNGYLASILERDVRDLANIEGLKELPNLLLMLAARAGGLLNFSEISRVSRISNSTLKRYLALLETVFLVVTLPAWFKNAEKRLVKSPKIYLNDTGLLTHLRGLNTQRLVQDRNTAGAILENFVVMELMKQRGWCETQPMLYHFRTQIGREVDIVMEAPDGSLVGIQVKSRSEVSASDFGGIKALQELVGKSFVRGIVLYTGQQVLNFGEGLTALPVGALWAGK